VTAGRWREWKDRADRTALVQLCTQQPKRIDASIAIRPSDGATLTTFVTDLIGYLRERELIRTAEPHRLKKLTLMWASEAEAPDGVRLES